MIPSEFSAGRRTLKLSQKEMGDALGGYSTRAVQAWEAGTRGIPPAVEKLMAILLTTNLRKGNPNA